MKLLTFVFACLSQRGGGFKFCSEGIIQLYESSDQGKLPTHTARRLLFQRQGQRASSAYHTCCVGPQETIADAQEWLDAGLLLRETCL